jgi:CubicO group peptidase (beta-lactamase class C family)
MEDRQQEFFCRTETKTGEIVHMKKYQILRSLLLLLCIASAWNNFYGQSNDADAAGQIDKLFSAYNAATPGVAVAVVMDGKIVFKKGYGTANLEYDIPVTTKTVFQIASVSKQFTAFSIYLLEKQGKISLEDDIRKHVPEMPNVEKTIRIKHLLAHTSGVKDQAALMSLAGWRSGDVATTQNVLRFLSRQKELNFEPGSQFLYSNSGYTLLAEIVRRVSGQSFAEFAKKNIFEPLGMKDTQINDDYERIVKNRADSYELENGRYKKKPINDSVAGASNLYTTVEDMAKWVLNFEKPVVGEAELIKRFNEPSLLNNGDRVIWSISDGQPGYHAKGQILWNERGVKRYSHGGHAAAFRSFLGRFPDQRLGVIALSNDEHYLNADTSMKIADLYLKDFLKPAAVTSPVTAPSRPAIEANTSLTDFEGRFYNEELNAMYTAKLANEKLFLSHIRHGDIALADAGKDKFSGRIEFPVEIEFVRNKDNQVTGFRVFNWGAKNVKFDKTKEQPKN